MSQKTAEILQQLEEGVQSLFDSDNYQKYLRFLSSFHSYSFRNSLLIHLQCRQRGITPSLCAPYREWQKKHRHVRRGEKGIAIIAPHTYKDGTDGEEARVGFHLAYTYDISMTDPDDDQGEAPEICHRLSGSLADENLLTFLTDIIPYDVSFDRIDGSANGFFNTERRSITVDSGNDQIQQVKTLLHEWAHAEHHTADPSVFMKIPSDEKELVAESAAYVVCQYLGIDSGGYSFGYLASWSRDRNTAALKGCMDTVHKLADSMILTIENASTQ